jgi:hypothetical protein
MSCAIIERINWIYGQSEADGVDSCIIASPYLGAGRTIALATRYL